MLNWRHHFNAALLAHFLISIEDAGLDDLELSSWECDFPDDPAAAAKAFGDEHDLTDVQECNYFGCF